MNLKNELSIIEKKLRMYACLIVQQHILFFKIKKYFLKLKFLKGKVSTISGPADLIEGFGRVVILLANGTNYVFQILYIQ